MEVLIDKGITLMNIFLRVSTNHKFYTTMVKIPSRSSTMPEDDIKSCQMTGERSPRGISMAKSSLPERSR